MQNLAGISVTVRARPRCAARRHTRSHAHLLAPGALARRALTRAPHLRAWPAQTVIIVAFGLLLVSLLLCHNYAVARWAIAFCSRVPTWLRACCAGRSFRLSAPRASARAAPAECAAWPAPVAKAAAGAGDAEAAPAPRLTQTRARAAMPTLEEAERGEEDAAGAAEAHALEGQPRRVI